MASDVRTRRQDSEVADPAAAAATRNERAIVARYTGGVAWPTVVLCVGLAAAGVGTIVLVHAGRLWLPLGVLVNSMVIYAFYTVHHDGTHRAISGRVARWRWLDGACGTAAAVALQLDHRGYSGVHLRHHAHTNEAGDPDVVLKGSLVALFPKWLIGTVLGLLGLLPFGGRLVVRIERALGAEEPAERDERRERESRRMRRWQRGCIVAMAASVPFGWFAELFWLWFVAAQIGILYLVVLFQWLPHFPYERTDRFGATRVNRFPGSSVLLLMQDHHLMHHLYPSVPWYRYRAVFRELRPFLEANDAIIQGRGTEPHVPIQLREAAGAPA